MIIQNSSEGFIMGINILREFILMINVLGWFVILYITFQIFKRAFKKKNKLTPDMGLTLYFVFFFFYYFLAVISYFYFEGFYNSLLQNLSIISINFGMFFFTLLTEWYFKTHQNMINLTGFPPLHKKLHITKIMIPFLIIQFIIPISLNWELIALFSNLIFMAAIIVLFAITNAHYSKIFASLEIVSRKKAPAKLSIGITLAGASNSFRGFEPSLGILVMLIIGSCMLIGGILVANAWSNYPDLTDLQWIIQLERLLVIVKEAFIPIVDFTFQKEKEILDSGIDQSNKDKPSATEQTVDASLAGGAIGGITSLLKEILATKSNIKKIDHEDKSILFNHGNNVICALIVSDYHYEQAYHLDQFALEFERKYRDELGNWQGDVSPFNNAKELINTIFQ